MTTDIVTGATTAVELELDVTAERLWKVITDVTRIGEWSPECVHAEWLGEPGVGARFAARNVFPHGFVGEVVCEVTEMTAPKRFAWKVLNADDGDHGSSWYYELVDRGDGVLVRNVFRHEAGLTGLREYVDQNPDEGAEILDRRLQELRTNMTKTLRAMAASA